LRRRARQRIQEKYKDHASATARLTWDRIDLAEGTVTLDGSMAKTRQRRIRTAQS
jgi:hypothetical protein